VVESVRYVTTCDGVRIAFATRGRGRPVVWMSPIPARHLALEWQQPGERRWLKWLASHYLLVQYDPRGLGLSDRDVSSYTLDAFERDLDAVVAQLDEPAVLFGKVNAAPLAIAYAARHPARVSHVILWCATARIAEGIGPHLDALVSLARQDWDLFVQTAAHLVHDWAGGESTKLLATLLRAALSPEAVGPLLRDTSQADVTDLLPRVRAPTLVLHRRDVSWVPVERGIELASRVPGAQLVVLEGNSMALWSGDLEPVRQAVDEFLGTDPPPGETVNVPEEGAGVVPERLFRSEGEYWTLAFAGRLCRVRDAKGLHHVAYLLQRPDEYVAALDLIAAYEGGAAQHGGIPVRAASRERTGRSVGDAGPVLDAEARRAYRGRLRELREIVEEAERNNDVGRGAAARTEMAFIEDQLAAAFGLAGRARRAASGAERARLTVTKRIRSAVGRIHACHPALGAHLGRCLRTGLFCCYVPEGERWPAWTR
jgi:pimeloyl-ACP methyl ester carboxylesterase